MDTAKRLHRFQAHPSPKPVVARQALVYQDLIHGLVPSRKILAEQMLLKHLASDPRGHYLMCAEDRTLFNQYACHSHTETLQVL